MNQEEKHKMAKKNSMTTIDSNWEARMDADTLARAEEIKASKARLARAKKASMQEVKKVVQSNKKISKLKPSGNK